MPITGADTASMVVGLRLRVEATTKQIRVAATIESYAFGRRIYEDHVTYKATWAEVVTWLGALLSGVDAERSVADYCTAVGP